MKIEGYVTDKNNCPVAGALVELKGESFETLFNTESGQDGYYALDIPAGHYPFLIAVKGWGVDCLEYWCQNISLVSDMILNISFDKLEVYGLHVFSVKGAGNSLMVYFRPMSLLKFKQGMEDIAPDGIVVKASIDNRQARIINTNMVVEYAGERKFSAYLLQVETSGSNIPWHRFDLQITDSDNNFGTATIFNVV